MRLSCIILFIYIIVIIHDTRNIIELDYILLLLLLLSSEILYISLLYELKCLIYLIACGQIIQTGPRYT